MDQPQYQHDAQQLLIVLEQSGVSLEWVRLANELGTAMLREAPNFFQYKTRLWVLTKFIGIIKEYSKYYNITSV